MSITRYRRTLLTGGTAAALDGIDGSLLSEGDVDEVFTLDNQYYLHRLSAMSGAAENSPFVIAPDVNPGDKRWLLQNVWTTESLVPYESTMTGNETFSASYTLQKRGMYILDGGGAERNFNPSGTFATGFEAKIINLGDENLIFDSATLAEVIVPGSMRAFVYNGSEWMA